MTRRPTIHERFYGAPPDADALVALWNADLISRLLTVVWKAYDELHEAVLSKLSWTEDYDDLERSISQEFESVIHRNMDGFESFYIQHGPSERESRFGGSAQPPEYDLAFIWYSDPRVMWPLEAKVLKTDKNTKDNLGAYVEAVNDRFLKCYYAPFSNGGAMLGYLKSGDPNTLFEHLTSQMHCRLISEGTFNDRHHRISEHQRTVPIGKDYPVVFSCHHLILPLFLEQE